MNRIDETFRRLRHRREKGLIAYLTVGFPSASALVPLVRACERAGVDLVELGIPFSDPLADGPTIQAASQKALERGMTPAGVLREIARLRKQGIRLPLVLMTYYNPVFHYGVRRFCRDAARAGADGILVPDLPPEEAGDLQRAARRYRLEEIFLASPTSSKERLGRIVRGSRGFVYYVSLTGVTGARRSLPAEIGRDVRALRKRTRLPICVGFGISRPDQARRVCQVADGVIVGSALIDAIARSGRHPEKRAELFLRKLKGACR